jgi:hypothetical protein
MKHSDETQVVECWDIEDVVDYSLMSVLRIRHRRIIAGGPAD